MIERRDGGHVFVENRQLILPNIRVDCRRLQTTVDMVDCSRLQAVHAAVLKRLPVLVFPEDWIVTCDPVRSRVRTGPNGPYGTLIRIANSHLYPPGASILKASSDHRRLPEQCSICLNGPLKVPY
jgi:hypothetical protein